MSKPMIVLATALALCAMSTDVLARGGGGGGGSKSGQSSSGTTSAARSVSTGTASGKRMHKPFTVTTQSGRASSLLRGNNSNDNGKGGRYLASSVKKVPGTRKTSTVTLKRGVTAEKVEAGSENVRRVK